MRARPHRLTHPLDAGDGDALFHGDFAPECEIEVVGIRPGEKLHEVMITEDDARLTTELSDSYVICQPFPDWSSTHLVAYGAKSMNEGFSYSSDRNSEWLDGSALNDLICRKAA